MAHKTTQYIPQTAMRYIWLTTLQKYIALNPMERNTNLNFPQISHI